MTIKDAWDYAVTTLVVIMVIVMVVMVFIDFFTDSID